MSPRGPGRLETLADLLLDGDPHRDALVGDLLEGHRARRDRGGRITASLWVARQLGSLTLRRWTRSGDAGPDAGAEANEASLGERLAHDALAALRAMIRRPAFTLGVTAVLAIAMAAVSAAFTVTVGTFESARAWRLDERTLAVWPERRFSMGQLGVLTTESTVFDAIGGYVQLPAVLALDGTTETAASVALSPSLFDALRGRPLLGRGLLAEDAQVGAEPVVVIARELWTRVYGGDPTVVGDLVEVNGVRRRLVGVMEAGAQHPGPGTEVWTPLMMDPFDPDFWPRHDLSLIAVTRAGVTPELARADVVRVFGVLAARYSFFYRPDFGRDATVALATERVWSAVATPLLLLLAGTGLLLLVAAIDVGNLVLARSLDRASELRVRAAVGASRGRVLQQIWVEAGLRAALAGLLGWALGRAAAAVLPSLFPAGAAVVAASAWAPSVMAFAAGIAALAWVLMAGIPTVHFLASARVDLVPRVARGRAPGGLVVAQAALATVLLIASALLIRTVWSLGAVPLGFDPTDVVAVSVAPRGVDTDPRELERLRADVAERVAAALGSRAEVGWISDVPLLDPVVMQPVNDEGAPTEVAAAPTATRVVVDPGALGALAALATALGGFGLYGALAGWVARRRAEIGTRMALGASPGRLAAGVLRTGVLLTALGVAVGSAGGVVAGRAMRALLFGVSPLDPVAFGLPAALLLATGVVAACIPAVRAAGVAPAHALSER